MDNQCQLVWYYAYVSCQNSNVCHRKANPGKWNWLYLNRQNCSFIYSLVIKQFGLLCAYTHLYSFVKSSGIKTTTLLSFVLCGTSRIWLFKQWLKCDKRTQWECVIYSLLPQCNTAIVSAPAKCVSFCDLFRTSLQLSSPEMSTKNTK